MVLDPVNVAKKLKKEEKRKIGIGGIMVSDSSLSSSQALLPGVKLSGMLIKCVQISSWI